MVVACSVRDATGKLILLNVVRSRVGGSIDVFPHHECNSRPDIVSVRKASNHKGKVRRGALVPVVVD